MPTPRKPEDVAVAFDAASREAGVAYTFVGAIAVGAWGQPRATSDVDCLVDLEPRKDTAFIAALKKQSFSLSSFDLAEARRDPSHVTVFDDTEGFNVDVKLAASPQERQEIREAAELDLGFGRIRVARAEETIAFKVAFGSEQDLKDARSILIRQAGKLDGARLMAHAERLGVADQVGQLVRAYGGGP
jgi:hypothetical protein